MRRRSLGLICRRISSAITGTSVRQDCSQNDCRMRCYHWDERRRSARPVCDTCTQQLGTHHPGGPRHGDGQARARTFSVPVTGHGVMDAAAAVRLARLQCDSQLPADYVRVRSFSTSSRGVKNRGDSFKRRQHRALSMPCAENNCVNANRLLTPTTDVSTAAELKVVVVGDARVGKRSIISQFTTSEYMHGTASG